MTLNDLTPQRAQVAQMVAEGWPDKHIADVMGIQSGTVRNHVSNIAKQIGVRKRDANIRVMLARWVWTHDICLLDFRLRSSYLVKTLD